MTIAGVSNASSSSAASSAAGISALVAQEAKIDAEISKTSNDNSLDAKSKAAKIQALQVQQAQLQAQIDQLRQGQHAARTETQKTVTNDRAETPEAKAAPGSFHVIA